MIFNANDLDQRARYHILIGAVLPRPIAWVSSMNAAGQLNLAPFSYFTIGATIPMTLLFATQIPYRTGIMKDTRRNIEEVPEFVINITNEDTLIPMNLSATELPHGESEFEWAKVTPAPSETIRVPRVAEAPISFECKLQRIVTISDQPGGGSVIFGEVQCIHIRDDLYNNGKINAGALKAIGRLDGDFYSRVNDIFEVPRVPAPKKEF